MKSPVNKAKSDEFMKHTSTVNAIRSSSFGISAISMGFRVLLGSSLLTCISACSLIPDVKVPGMDRVLGEEGIFRDRKEEYLEAQTIPPLEIPEGLDSYVIDDLLVIPELANSEALAFPDAPRPIQVEGASEREVVVQRMKDRSWIIADANPSQVWPRIRDYWRQKSIPITTESPNQGVMETGWFVLEGNVLTRDRIRVTVETGFQNNSSEIKLLHQSAPQLLSALEGESWPEVSVDNTVAYDLTLDLSQYLADVANLTQASSASMLAGTLSSAGKADLVETSDGDPLLKLQADIDRSWAAVRRVITRNEIEVLQEDSALGIIDINFDPDARLADEEEEKPGFFKRLITLNGIFSREEGSRSVKVRLQLMPSGEYVEVLAVPHEEETETAETTEAVNTFMRLLRNTIA